VAADQRGSTERPNATQPGQPVRRISPQDREVGVPAARDLVAAGDLGLVDDGQTRLLRIQHTDARILNEREQIAVTAGDLDRPADLRSQRGDHVLGLVARRPDHIDADGTQDPVDHRDLRHETRRNRFGGAMLLVASKLLDAPLRPPIDIVRHRDAGRAALDDQTSQAEEEPANRSCPEGLSILQPTLGAIERPEDQA